MSELHAQRLFLRFLAQGPGADFEAFCAAHPEQASALRAFHDVLETRGTRVQGAEFQARPGSGSSPSALLLQRLVAREPRGPRYASRGEIARGGMGAILSVWDEDLGRELAMKVVLGRDGESANAITPGDDGRRLVRFLEEAQVTGQLEHPCVVPVHELGIDEQGRAFFTMRMVRGRHLGRVFDLVARGEEDWSETRALGVMLRVCEAVAYAHSKGVIHRDLKPANVMVGSFGEVYVMDWGLARVEGRPDAHDLRLSEDPPGAGVSTLRSTGRLAGVESSIVTMDGDVLGTPAYMPPEQARGEIEQLSARSDVYAIGAMLYELLARRMPYTGEGGPPAAIEVLRAVLAGPPTPLSLLRPDVPPELEAICEKAMARDPLQRYASTVAFAEDLRAFLEGRVVQAYRTGALVELRKWVGRNRALASAAALAVLFLTIGLATSLWQKRLADRNARLATEQAAEAERKGELAQRSRELAERRELEAAASARRAEAVGGFLTKMLASADPKSAMRRDMPVSAVIDDASERLDAGEFADDPHTELALRSTLGRAYGSIFRLEESEREHRRALELSGALPDVEPEQRASLVLDLAQSLVSRGSSAEAEQRLIEAERTLSDAGLPDDPLRPRLLGLLAIARYTLGRTDQAIELLRTALSILLAHEDEDSEPCALMRSRLAFYLSRLGEREEALELTDRAIRVLQHGSPQARIEVVQALRVRAHLQLGVHKHGPAIADLEEALRLRTAIFGEDSGQVAEVLTELALALQGASRLDAAKEPARRAVEIRSRLLGEHNDTATSLSVLGVLLRQTGELKEARELLEASLAMRRAIFPEGHPAIGDSLFRLGKLALDQGELALAERLLRESLENWEQSLGPEHPSLPEIWITFGQLLRQTGRAAEARPLLERAVDLRARLFGEFAPPTNEARDELTSVLLAAGHFTAAEELLRATLEGHRSRATATGSLVHYLGAQLGAALLKQGRLEEAEPLLLAGWEAIGEDPRMWTVNKLFLADHLVELYEELGATDEAAHWRAKAESLRR